jgi:N5-(carboxyethyl)ornithine synthase
MKTIGFAISKMENERRRALIPPDLNNVEHVDHLYFETDYGEVLGYSDQDYLEMGVHVVKREIVYEQDIICNPKAPEPGEREFFKEGQTLFSWIHAVQGKEITDFLLGKKMTGIAWEEMYKNSRHIFWRNNEIAGEAAILHAFLCYGRAPYECLVAVVGRGNCARGAIRVLEKMGAKIIVYDRKTVQNLRDELDRYDVVVNAVLWDLFRKDHLIYREDLRNMKKGAMIIDISCDPGLGIESSSATTIENPVYIEEGILHYAVDHTPTLLWKTATGAISKEVKKYIDDLVEENDNEVLKNATIIKDGIILDEKIIKFQER